MDNAQTGMPKCPECDTPLAIPTDVLVGQIIQCPSCGTENEIIETNPLTLAPLEEEK